jgi:hypothetical protein
MQCIVLWGTLGHRCPFSPNNMQVVQDTRDTPQIPYRVSLRWADGSLAEFRPHGVDQITSNATSLNISKARAAFPHRHQNCWKSPQGPKDIIAGMGHMSVRPIRNFSTKVDWPFTVQVPFWHWISGMLQHHGPMQENACDQLIERNVGAIKVSGCTKSMFMPPEFIAS